MTTEEIGPGHIITLNEVASATHGVRYLRASTARAMIAMGLLVEAKGGHEFDGEIACRLTDTGWEVLREDASQ